MDATREETQNMGVFIGHSWSIGSLLKPIINQQSGSQHLDPRVSKSVRCRRDGKRIALAKGLLLTLLVDMVALRVRRVRVVRRIGHLPIMLVHHPAGPRRVLPRNRALGRRIPKGRQLTNAARIGWGLGCL